MAAQYAERQDAGLYLALHAVSPLGRTEGQIYRVDQGGCTAEEWHLGIKECVPWRKRSREQGIISWTHGHEVASRVEDLRPS